MSDEQNENQAAKLEQLFLEVSNPEIHQEQQDHRDMEDFIEVDVLQLPPRSEVHQKGKMTLHPTLDAPIWRFVIVIMILVVVAGLLYGLVGDNIIEFFTS